MDVGWLIIAVVAVAVVAVWLMVWFAATIVRAIFELLRFLLRLWPVAGSTAPARHLLELRYDCTRLLEKSLEQHGHAGDFGAQLIQPRFDPFDRALDVRIVDHLPRMMPTP